MNLKINLEKLWQKTILFLFLVLTWSLIGCARNCVILTESEMRPIIQKGTTYKALWDGKEQEFIAEQDRIALPKGDYLKLQKEANANTTSN